MTKTLSRKKITCISREAHLAAWHAGEMFGSQHKFQQGFVSQQSEAMYVKHGYHDENLEFIPVSEMVKGALLRNKKALREMGALEACRLMRQSFAGHKHWLVDGVEIKTRQFMEPVSKFLADNSDHVDVFAGVYENDFTGTNVFGMFIMVKDVEGNDRLAWQITIDDVDLHERAKPKALYR